MVKLFQRFRHASIRAAPPRIGQPARQTGGQGRRERLAPARGGVRGLGENWNDRLMDKGLSPVGGRLVPSMIGI
jgi:hypothetical protein